MTKYFILWVHATSLLESKRVLERTLEISIEFVDQFLPSASNGKQLLEDLQISQGVNLSKETKFKNTVWGNVTY